MGKIKDFKLKVNLGLKKLLFWLAIDNAIVKLTRIPLVTTMVPAVTGAYLALRKLYGDESIFKLFPDEHSVIAVSLITATIIIALFKSAADSYLSRHESAYITLLHKFIRLNASIVNAKDKRFKKRAKTLEKGDEVFERITQPTDQINFILSEARGFLIESFDLKNEDNLRITILEQVGNENSTWSFAFDTHEAWSYTQASELMSSKSAAKECLETGQPLFHADKAIAAVKGKYLLSERDDRLGNGSVYCYPVFIKRHEETYRAIITLITYGNRKFCGGYDDRENDQLAVMLREICRRLELELTLRFIKQWKLSMNTDGEV